MAFHHHPLCHGWLVSSRSKDMATESKHCLSCGIKSSYTLLKVLKLTYEWFYEGVEAFDRMWAWYDADTDDILMMESNTGREIIVVNK